IVERRQARHRADQAIGGERIDCQSIVGKRRSTGLKRLERSVHCDGQALDIAAGEMFVEPITYLGGDECRPQFFQRLGIHPGRCKAGGETKTAAGVSALPDMATPTSALPISPWLIVSRLLAESKRPTTPIRLRMRGSPPLGVLSTALPPVILNAQLPCG